ncbi:hypothetical protein P168DRAFT_333267 [Aspergillus campestris IBT 28561]|uniref:Uncharacterized protein n=1 Tax=Aspergillus campestris (strain IBT 28561) TaxID=1392248 RepID=A0A2I1CWI5_ASPC2|nr:uncharacterized protein P168DRAFT_333267 [Aspergillus campestris IBT 28561]PKY01980.1 hypothetical protein P168DRAFT_333267 [Aspergillus campestris IBT 28561]
MDLSNPSTTSTLRTRTLDDFLADDDQSYPDPHTHNPSTTTTALQTEAPTEKRTRTTTTTKPPTKDWMVVQGNTHYARDYTTFLPQTYRRTTQTLSNNIFDPSSELHVAGLGTVRVAVQTGPAPTDTNVLELHDVLHIPDAVCNGFNPLLYGSSMSCYEGFWEGRVPGREGPEWVARGFAGGARLVLAGGEGEDGVGR